MKNVYDGNVELDDKGEAWIQMPDYFEALNREFRYQLTPIGGPAPSLFNPHSPYGARHLLPLIYITIYK